MSLSQYQAFLKTIQLGNLTKAAEELGYTQSGITHLLNALENSCGLKLVVRDKSGAYPTSDGKEMIPFFEEICQAYSAMENKLNELQRLDSGLIRVVAFTSVSVQWLPGILVDYLRHHPKVDFQILHGTEEETVSMIKSGEADCAFVSGSDKFPFDTYDLYKDPLVAVLPADHPLTKKSAVTVEEIAQCQYIELADSISTKTKEIADVFIKHKVKPTVRFSEVNDYAVVAMIEKGLGVSILPNMLVSKSSRNIAIRPLKSGESRTISIGVKSEQQLSGQTKEFIAFVREWVKENV
ncbi:MAG: LysR family transcriptional regulator [Eubacterium sp.]|jgi:DNA-binding transcriptional LysR family regulator